MRKTFGEELYRQMKENDNIYLLVGDLGWGLFDRIREDFPERFINCGAAETAMVDIAIGLALSGKIPFVYSITTFLLYRPFESLRTYIDYEKIPVKLIGSGRGREYEELGYSHFAEDDFQVTNWLLSINKLTPKSKSEIKGMVEQMILNPYPYYLSLSKNK